MDKISIERVKLLHPSLREEALSILEQADKLLTGRASLRYAHTLRTFAEQDALFQIGRIGPSDKRSKVTDARGGQSWHNFGLALDIVLLLDGGKSASWDIKSDFDQDRKSDWMEVVELFKAVGWKWGGDWIKFKDYPHFEKVPKDLTISAALYRYQKKDFVEKNYIRL